MLGIARSSSDELFAEWGDFSLTDATDEIPPTRGLHIGFAASSRELVDEFWRAGIGAGAPDEGEPGPRPQYGDDYYAAFLLDPDGSSVEAVHHGSVGAAGIDHLWLRVADVASSRAFYLEVAPYTGFSLRTDTPERVQLASAAASFSLVHGSPVTQNLHVAFLAAANETVGRFHAAATAAGYRDNGGPGERPVYHPGYYAAFVVDPDGTNVEVVCHNRA